MASIPPSSGPTSTAISSLLSEAPSTALLNRVEQELGLENNPIDIDSIAPPTLEEPSHEPRTHKALDGTHYIELLVKRNKGKSRTAWYWKHGAEFEAQNKTGTDGKHPRVWTCNHCRVFHCYGVNSSVHINKHLRTHNLYENKPVHQRVSIAERLQHHAPMSVDTRPLAEADRRLIHQVKFEEALVAFICCVHIAFSIVENEFFVAMLVAASNLISHVLPTSHTTVRDWTVQHYQRRKLRVKNLLHKARSRVHLSFDLWTSTNHYAFNPIVAHFVSVDYTITSVLLAFRNLLGPHSGENIAASVQDVVQEYEIQSSLGCFVLDNAHSNDTAVEKLGKLYKWPKNEYRQRRLRCIGHIINLVAQAFILGEKQEIFE
jgi:hypothetical protein